MQDPTEAPVVIDAPDPPDPAGEVLARFRSPEAMDRAIERLKVSGFDRGSLGVPEIDPPASRATPEADSAAIATSSGMQQRRVFYTSVLGAFAAMIGALIAAAEGWGMGGIGGLAIGLGIVVAIVAELVSRAMDKSTLRTERRRAASGKLVLAVRTRSPESQERATTVLRDSGGEVLDLRLHQPSANSPAASSSQARTLPP